VNPQGSGHFLTFILDSVCSRYISGTISCVCMHACVCVCVCVCVALQQGNSEASLSVSTY
jgi:hypothetical protein